jgi:phosphopantothenoylcysteine synthetase/decarboxylase
MSQLGRMLTVIVCGAGPASDVGKLVKLAQVRGWTVQLVATPAALPFLNTPELESLTGSPVRSEYRSPGESRSPKADAVIVAPATYNTICKCAQGVSDNYPLGLLAEAISLPVPVVILPFVNTALAARQPFQRSVSQLRDEGALILLGRGMFEPHEPGTGGDKLDAFPWHLALEAVDRAASRSD